MDFLRVHLHFFFVQQYSEVPGKSVDLVMVIVGQADMF